MSENAVLCEYSEYLVECGGNLRDAEVERVIVNSEIACGNDYWCIKEGN